MDDRAKKSLSTLLESLHIGLAKNGYDPTMRLREEWIVESLQTGFGVTLSAEQKERIAKVQPDIPTGTAAGAGAAAVTPTVEHVRRSSGDGSLSSRSRRGSTDATAGAGIAPDAAPSGGAGSETRPLLDKPPSPIHASSSGDAGRMGIPPVHVRPPHVRTPTGRSGVASPS